jgi:hypothetical protein
VNTNRHVVNAESYDIVKMKDVRDFRMVAANTTEVRPGNPCRDVTDLPQWTLTCEVSSTSPVLVYREGSSEDGANVRNQQKQMGKQNQNKLT